MPENPRPAPRDEAPCWVHRETHYHPADEALAATRFFLGNGLLGLRGSLDELGTRGVQGCYAAGFFRKRFVRQFETADNYTRKRYIFDEEIMPHGAEIYEIQGLPDVLFCRITLGHAVFRMWEGEVTCFQRELDLRTGTLVRSLRWRAPSGEEADLRFERFCAWDDPRAVWQRITITSLQQTTVLLAPGIDPLLEPDLGGFELDRRERGFDFSAKAVGSALAANGAQRWVIRRGGEIVDSVGEDSDVAGRPVTAWHLDVPAGQTVQIERVTFLAPDNHPVWRGGLSDLAGLAEKALARGYDESLRSSTAALAAKWEFADIVLDGPVTDQFSLRYSLYQLLAAAPWDYDHISLGAKCLSGPGYNGHVFWDNDINILPFYQWVFPQVAANHCRYRHRMLGDARRLAAAEGRPGARYPWQSCLEGFEHAPAFIRCSRSQIHVVADVAFAANRLLEIAGTDVLPPEMVAEITIECARYLRSRLVRNEALGRLELHGVGGPDEYHPITNNNAYTNHLTADILRRGADWARTHPAITAGLQVSGDEIADWERAAGEIFLPFDPATGLIPQCDGFHDLAETWEQVGSQWGGIGAEFERCKGLKQPDVLLLLTLLPGQFPRHVWRTNWDYYERFILHGSSLSPSIHALVGARVGLPQRARHYFDIAANFEFRNHNKDTQHGIHIGNCGGVWQAVVLGFAGLGEADGGLSLDPALPAEWKSLQFTILWQGQRFSIKASNLRVVICAAETNSRAVVWRVFGQEHLISPSREETIERKS